MEYGAIDYCLKPIELAELVEKLLVALREAGAQRKKACR
jgi:DNA-binding response OmpR family regulator